MSQVGDYVPELRQPALNFCRFREACANAPPNPSHADGKRQLIFQLGDHLYILVSVKKPERHRQPLSPACCSDQVQQEDQ